MRVYVWFSTNILDLYYLLTVFQIKISLHSSFVFFYPVNHKNLIGKSLASSGFLKLIHNFNMIIWLLWYKIWLETGA